MFRSKCALKVLCVCFVMILGLSIVGIPCAHAGSAGNDFAAAAKLFIREDSYYGHVAIWFSYDAHDSSNRVKTNNYLNLTKTSSWCSWFVQSIAKTMGIKTSVIPRPSGGSGSDYTATSQTQFHALVEKNGDRDYLASGQFDASYVPQIGDIVTFAWSPYGPKNCHVGIVSDTKKQDNMYWFRYVSGNFSATVKESSWIECKDYTNSYTTNHYKSAKPKVVGFFHPNWSQVSSWRSPTPVSSVDIQENNVTLAIGDVYTPTCTVSPSSAFCNVTIWTSSDTSVATVEKYYNIGGQMAKITAVGEGTATITARAIADGQKSSSNAVQDTITVTVSNASTNNWQLHVMTIGRINVMDSPSDSGTIICPESSITDYHFYIDASQPIDYGGWAYVKLMDGTTGWVNLAGTEVLPTVPRPSASEMQPFKAKMRVNMDDAARWDAPGGALFPRGLMEGSEVTVESKYTDKNGQGWYYVENFFMYETDLNLIEMIEEPKTEYVVVIDEGLYINKEYNKKNVRINNMSKGTHFWADMSTAVKAGNYTWALCSLSDGTTGWVAISNPDYCIPVQSTDIPVTGLDTFPNAITCVGCPCYMIVDVEPTNATNPTLTWSIEDDSVAFIDMVTEETTECVLMGKEAGNTTLTISTTDGSGVKLEIPVIVYADHDLEWVASYDPENPDIKIENLQCKHCLTIVDSRNADSSRLPGDANGDGEVNPKDATRIIKWFCGYDVSIIQQNCDVNEDGDINPKDATRIIKWFCGYDVVLK